VLQSDAPSCAPEVAKEVARLAREILGPGVEVIWFGSWPGGRARPHSDIDVAVRAASPIGLEKITLLREAVEDLPTLYGVDLLDLGVAGKSLREEVMQHGVRL